MAGEAVIGSAAFVLTADDAQLRAALANDERLTRDSAQKQAQALAQVDAAHLKAGADATRAAAQIKSAGDQAAASAAKTEAAHRGAAEGFKLSGGEALKMGAAMAGAQVGIEGFRKVIESVSESTKEAAQAQFALGKTYGASAPEMAAFAKAYGDEIGRSNTEVQKSAVLVGNLTKEYGLSGAQAKELVRISGDLAAKYGSDLPEATKRLQAAIRGEAESAEELGLVLNDQAVATRQLGAENQQLFYKLTDQEKAQLRLLEATRQLGEAQGSAAERAAGPLGAFDRLKKSSDELGASIGQHLLPPAAATADVLAGMGQAAIGTLAALDRLAHMDLGELARIAGAIANPVAGAGVLGSFIAQSAQQQRAQQQIAQTAEETRRQADKAIADADAAATRAQILATGRRRQDLEDQKDANDKKLAGELDRIDKEKAAEDRAYEQKRIGYEVDRDNALKALKIREDATLQELADEHQATKDGFAQQIADAEQARDAGLKGIADRKDATLAGLDAEKQAAKDAADANIVQIEAERDAAIQAAQDRHDAVAAGYEADKQALAALRQDEDRQRSDSRAAEDRDFKDSRDQQDQIDEQAHKRSLARLTEEQAAYEKRAASRIKSVETERDATLAALDAQIEATKQAAEVASRALEVQHQAALKGFASEKEALDDGHAAAGKRFEQEAAAARTLRDQHLREISDLGDAAGKQHDQELRDIAGAGDAAKAASAQTLRDLDVEAAADKQAHDQRVRDLSDEVDAARAAYDQESRRLADLADQAGRAHDNELADIKRESDAEDDRHRSALAAIDAESKARQDALDAQLRALDAADKAAQDASTVQGLNDRVATARSGLAQAQNSGNQKTIDDAARTLLEAEQALVDGQNKIQRDGDRQRLQDAKDSLSDEVQAAKDAEAEKNRQVQASLSQAKIDADARLKLVQDGVTADKQAAKDRLDGIQAVADAQKVAADDEYTRQQADIAARKVAVSDELTRIQTELSARKTAADDAYTATQARLAKEKTAEDDGLTAALLVISKEKDAEGVAYDQAVKDLDARKTKEGETYAAEKLAAADALTVVLGTLSKRKTAVSDEATAAIGKLKERDDAEKIQHDKDVARINERFDLAKTRLGIQRTDEDRALADSRTAEDRTLADSRKAEDLAFAAQGKANDQELANEKRALDQHYNDGQTGVIAILKNASELAGREYVARRQAAEKEFGNETTALKAQYDGPDGIIPTIRKKSEDFEREYSRRLAAARVAFDAERIAIGEVYTNAAKTGLLDKLEEAHKETDRQLGEQVTSWQKWKKDVTDEIDQALKKLQEFNSAATQPNPEHGFSGGSQYGPPVPGSDRAKYEPIARAAAAKAGINADQFVAQIAEESNFDPAAKSGAGALGIAQFTLPTARSLGLQDPLGDPVASLTTAAQYMAQLIHKYGDRGTALVAYNAGEGNAQRWDGTPKWLDDHGLQETHKYLHDLGYPGFARGTVINRPTWLADVATGALLGMAGETGQPERLLGVGATRAYDASLQNYAPIKGSRDAGLLVDPEIRMPASWNLDGSGYSSVGGFTPPVLPAAGVSGAPVNRYELSLTLGNQKWAMAVFDAIGLNIRSGNIQEIRR